jgi:hypothetical protein
MRNLAGLLFVSLVCTACLNTAASFEPGKTTLMELVRSLGQPSMVWSEGDGTLLVEFARIGSGGGNFMARVAPNGVMQSMQEVLTEARVAALQPGMTRDAVRRHLGQPARIDNQGKDEIWHWPLDSHRPAQWQVDAHFGARGSLERVARTRIALQSPVTAGAQAGQKVRPKL